MSPSGDNRSVQAGSIVGSNVVTGDQNTITSTIHVALPPAGTVDPKAELAALRQALAGLQTPERGKLDRALQDAEEEAAKRAPDKTEISGALQRAVKAAKGANDFAGQVETLAPRIAALASWLGTAGHALLALAGLSA
jgi:uncharacterized membrane protein